MIGHSDLNGHGNGGQVVVQNRNGSYYAFIGHMKDMGTSIVDVTNQFKPQVLAQVPIPEGTHSHKVRVCGEIMLVNNEGLGNSPKYEAGLRIFDVSNPSRPRELSFFRTGGKGVHRFWLNTEKRLAYLSSGMKGYNANILLIVDFSDPAKPFEVSRWWVPGQWVEGGEKPSWRTGELTVHNHLPIVLGDRAYLAYWDGGIIILDISDIRNIRMISRATFTPPYGGAYHTALPVSRPIMGYRWLIVFQESLVPDHGPREGEKLMWMVNITEEKNPVPVATFNIPEEGYNRMLGRFGPHQPYEDVNVKDNLLYSAWFQAGLRIIDISNPYKPREAGYCIPQTPETQAVIQTNDVCLDDRGYIYIIDRLTRGLDILKYTGDS